MSLFSSIFSSGVGKLVDSIGNTIDNLVTSDEERGQLKIQFEKELNDFKVAQLNALAQQDKEVSNRHQSDMKSDSWLSKNIRPLSLAFLTISTVVLAYLTIFILDSDQVKLIEPWLDLLKTLLITMYAFYFGSRGVEKVQSIKNRSTA